MAKWFSAAWRFVWGRIGDASTIVWLFPGLGAAVVGYTTFIVAYIKQAPPWTWIPLTAFGAFLALLAARSILVFLELWQERRSPAHHDISLQDAVAFAISGHWPTVGERTFGGPNDLNKMTDAIGRLRDLAHRGKLTVWGKINAFDLHTPISSSFWITNAICLESLWGPPETPRTEPTSFGSAAPFTALRVNKAQLERAWRSK